MREGEGNTRRARNQAFVGRGRRPGIRPMTEYEARQKATEVLLKGGPPPGAAHAIEILASEGIVREAELMERTGVAYDTLRRYRHTGYLQLIHPAPVKLTRVLREPRLKLYALGPVGLQLAGRGGQKLPKGYLLDAGVDHITHDVLCNLVVRRLLQSVEALGCRARRRNKYEATVHDERGRPVLEPDAMIELGLRNGPGMTFLVEYHNEDRGMRVADKVQKYEKLLAPGVEQRWRAVWNCPQGTPVVLVVWTHRIVGETYRAYLERVDRGGGLQGSYLGRSLESFLEGEDPLLWADLRHQQPLRLLG